MNRRTMALSRSARLALLGAVMLVLPGTVYALGLGKLIVHSALNERLNAEIPFTSLSKKELKTLAVSLNPRPGVSRSGFEPSAWSGPIGIHLLEQPDGRVSLQLQSQHVIREPYLQLVVQAEWAGGRLIREFTALINPRDPLSEVASAAAPAALGPPIIDFNSEAPAQSASSPEQSFPAIGGSEADLTIERLESSQQLSQESSSSKSAPATSAAEEADTDDSRSATLSAKEEELSERIRVLESQITTLSGLLTLKNKTLRDTEQLSQETTSPPVGIESSETRPSSLSEASMRADAATQEPVNDSVRQASNVEQPNQASQRLGVESKREWMFTIRQMLMGVVVLISGVLVISGVVTFVKRRRTVLPSIQASDSQVPVLQAKSAADEPPVFHERRSSRGRRQRFVPVPFERRRGPRRERDHIATHVGQLYSERAGTLEETETYIACGQHDHAEQALKDAITRNPDRHALKVKLLALYHQRQHIAEFESLANELYAALEPGVRLDHKEGKEDTDDTGGNDASEMLQSPVDEPFGNTAISDGDGESSEPLFFDMDHSTDEEARVDQELESFSVDFSTNKESPSEHDMEALDMDVPKTEDELTQNIMDELSADGEEETDSGEEKETTDRGLEVLEIEDFADITQAVDQGLSVIEPGEPIDDSQSAGKKTAKKKKTAKSRSKTNKKKTKASEEAQAQDNKQEQWRNPATKIDLAKAYIEMGDAERARHLLDEVLENWQQGDGSQS